MRGLTGAREPIRLLCQRSRGMGLVGLGVVLRVASDAAPAQQADGERPARGDERRGDPQIHFLLVRGEEGAAGRTRGKRRREDRHQMELRQGKAIQPAKFEASIRRAGRARRALGHRPLRQGPRERSLPHPTPPHQHPQRLPPGPARPLQSLPGRGTHPVPMDYLAGTPNRVILLVIMRRLTYYEGKVYASSLCPEFAVHRHLQTWNPCIDGVSFPKRLNIHRHMHRMI